MIVLVLGLHSTRYEGLRSRSGGGHENGGRSEQRVVGDSKGDGLMKRRRMTSAGGSLKKATVAVAMVVEVKVGVTRCHFLQPTIVIFVRRFGILRVNYICNQPKPPSFKVGFEFLFFIFIFRHSYLCMSFFFHMKSRTLSSQG